MLIPKEGTMERVVLDRLIESDAGVTYMDFAGYGLTDESLAQIVQNLRTGMFEAENDDELRIDA